MQQQKKTFLLATGLIGTLFLHAQTTSPAAEESWKDGYRATATKYNDLINTRLEVKFDYDKSYLYGKEWVTLKPHLYPTDSLTLDAKGMDIHQLELVKEGKNIPLKYDYDGMLLRIHLDRTYKYTDKYTLYIDYTAKPDELKIHQGSAAITDSKGLYFINPKGLEKNKPTQIWTQGETEANSVWFPTIDKPNQKTTEEITMTVPQKYVTLSNGVLVGQKNNGDGTRTDHWKMDLPHAPYLFFMGVGDYAIVKDSYKGKEVNYYVEKEYAPVARRIFGNTPEMIAFYVRLTGIEYPWPKYDQIVGRDYVSGAMENTTSTLHEASAQQDARQLTDGNAWESVIAHELFHQWFGDLVTTESWSNLTVNESFADYSETLWNEYKYGKDAGDAENFSGMEKYLEDPQNAEKNLVRFHYADKEDVFDAVTYSKGGRILNMLRNYVGDSAFFKSLNLYLTTNKFKSAEAEDLRLAFEAVTGEDLNWFWNEWYYGSGHPKLTIDYLYDETGKKVSIITNQTQGNGKIFRLPVAIDIYNGPVKERHRVWIENKTDTFTFSYQNRPDLVNVDGDKMLLCEKNDNKTLENFIHQYKYAGRYLDRREAIDFCVKNPDDPKAVELLKTSLKDHYDGLRNYTLNNLDWKKESIRKTFEPLVAGLATHDPSRTVKATAIEVLGSFGNPDYKALFTKATADSSYTVAGNALEALAGIDSIGALTIARKLIHEPSKGELSAAISVVLINAGDANNFGIITDNFEQLPMGTSKMELAGAYTGLLVQISNPEEVKRGVDLLLKVKKSIPQAYKSQMDPYFNRLLNALANQKKATGLSEQADYIKSKLASENTGF